MKKADLKIIDEATSQAWSVERSDVYELSNGMKFFVDYKEREWELAFILDNGIVEKIRFSSLETFMKFLGR